MAAALHRRRHSVRAAAVRPPGVHPVHLRHHRQAEVHRARRGRHAAAEPQDAQAAVRPPAGRPLLLFLHHQLGGVEPALRRALRGGERDALRRLALRARREDSFRLRGQGALHALRHFGEVHRRHREARPAPARHAPARRAAHDPVHRLAARAGELRLCVRRREERRLPVFDLGGHRHHGRLRRRQSHPAGVPRRAAVPLPRNCGGSV